MRLNGGKRRPAGGSAERRLRFAVASNVPFAVKAVESETREGAPNALPPMRSPAAFQRVYIFRGKETPRFEQRVSPPRDALFVGRRALQTFERSLKSGTVSVVSRVAHNGKEL